MESLEHPPLRFYSWWLLSFLLIAKQTILKCRLIELSLVQNHD